MADRDHKKFSEIMRFIYNNIDKPMSLEDISKNANISLASLKRLFHAAIEQSPGAFIRRLRMELAFRSLQNRENSVLEIALAAGFDDHAAFSRRFKKIFGYPPSKARKKINLIKEFESIELEEPEILQLEDIPVQAFTETGIYFESAPKAWNKLREQLNQDELSDDFSGIFIGVGHDNPHEGDIAEDKVRFSACVSLLERNIGGDRMIIKGGRYARFYYHGKPNNLGLAYHYIFGQWQETSSENIDKKNPPFLVFEKFPENFKNQNIIIYVPLMRT